MKVGEFQVEIKKIPLFIVFLGTKKPGFITSN